MKKLMVQDLLKFLNQFAPPRLAEDWDSIGLQVGTLKSPVQAVLVALDVTPEVLKEAVQRRANVLITHHPLFLHSRRRTPFVKFLVTQAKRLRLNILSFHTNLDATEEGLNNLLAHQLKLHSLKPLMPSRSKKYPHAGLGRVGQISRRSFSKFLDHVSHALGLKQFRFVGNPQQKIQSVAVMTGSGGDFFSEARQRGADVLVTGDVKYHQALEALAEGICLVDIGHFHGEIGMVKLVASKTRVLIKQKKTSLPIYETQVQEDPFTFF